MITDFFDRGHQNANGNNGAPRWRASFGETAQATHRFDSGSEFIEEIQPYDAPKSMQQRTVLPAPRFYLGADSYYGMEQRHPESQQWSQKQPSDRVQEQNVSTLLAQAQRQTNRTESNSLYLKAIDIAERSQDSSLKALSKAEYGLAHFDWGYPEQGFKWLLEAGSNNPTLYNPAMNQSFLARLSRAGLPEAAVELLLRRGQQDPQWYLKDPEATKELDKSMTGSAFRYNAPPGSNDSLAPRPALNVEDGQSYNRQNAFDYSPETIYDKPALPYVIPFQQPTTARHAYQNYYGRHTFDELPENIYNKQGAQRAFQGNWPSGYGNDFASNTQVQNQQVNERAAETRISSSLKHSLPAMAQHHWHENILAPLAHHNYSHKHGLPAYAHQKYSHEHGAAALSQHYSHKHGAAALHHYNHEHGLAALSQHYNHKHGTAALHRYNHEHGLAALSHHYNHKHGLAALSHHYNYKHGLAALSHHRNNHEHGLAAISQHNYGHKNGLPRYERTGCANENRFGIFSILSRLFY